MKKMMKFSGLTTAVLAFLLVGSNVVLAQDAEPERHIIRAYAGYLTATGDSTLNLDTIELDDTSGFGVGYELKCSPLIGIPIEYSVFGPDVKAGNGDSASADFNPATLGLNFHLIHSRVIDFYLGAEAVYVDYGSSNDVDIDSETTWGAKAGIDFKILTWLGIGASVEYIDASADFKVGNESGSLDPKPVVSKLGVSFRF